MRRGSRRELAKDIDDLSDGAATQSDEPGHLVVYEHPETGDWYNNRDCTGAPLDDVDDPVMVIVLDAAYTEGTSTHETGQSP
jgi:hypothetical protein